MGKPRRESIGRQPPLVDMGSVCENIHECPGEQRHQDEAEKEACAEARPGKEKKESFSGRVASATPCATPFRFITNQLIRAAWLVSRYRFQRFEGECLFHTTVGYTHRHTQGMLQGAVAASRSTSSHNVDCHLNLMTSPAAATPVAKPYPYQPYPFPYLPTPHPPHRRTRAWKYSAVANVPAAS